ncbi:MAG: transposase [Gemmatimonadetes bacterium]|nr:transposase [Gemmatimonadota bacterium]
MDATKLTKVLLVLSLGLGSVALALHQDNTDRRDKLETLNERLQHLETAQWNYEVNAALKEKLHRKLLESVAWGRFAKFDESAAGDGRPFVVVVSTSRTCGACLFDQLDQWKQAMAQRGVSHGKLLLVVGDANEQLKQQIAIKHKVGLVPFAFTFVAERDLEALLFQSDARSSVPVSFVVNDAFEVLNWHYSDKGDEAATAQCIQDWLDRYFTS